MSGEQLVAVHRNFKGDIISFQTSEGRIISYRKALQDAENGVISGVNIVEDIGMEPMLEPEINSSFDELPNIY